MSEPRPQPNNPLHGLTLEFIVTRLSDRIGWREMARLIPLRCFMFDPSVKSSLVFLRKTPWVRARVEDLYLQVFPPA